MIAEGSDYPLDYRQHSCLRLIKPKLDLEKGKLTLTGPEAFVSPENPSTLSISLWDSPFEQYHKDIDHLPVQYYRSEAVRTFFTNILGIPRTLARFKDQRGTLKEKHMPAIARETLSLGVSLLGKKSSANLTLVFASTWMQNRYLMINGHLFEKLEFSATKVASNLWHITHLSDAKSRSAETQNSCIRIGDEVRSFSSICGFEESRWKAIVALDSIARYFVQYRTARRNFRLILTSNHICSRINDEQGKPSVWVAWLN